MLDLDRSRSFQSDRTLDELKRLEKTVIKVIAKLISPKCRRTQSLLTGFQFGGIMLKGRSAGGWRSGMQRSEK